MYKILIDSDSLIKASKAGFLYQIVHNFEVFITKNVHDEAVTEGKKGFYEDTEIIERLIKDDKIMVIKNESYKNKKKPKENFGGGEISIFQAYKKGFLIVSDDLSFTKYVKEQGINIISSVNLLYLLYQKHRLSKSEANYCLERLKPFIRKSLYEEIKKDLGGQ